MHWWASIFGIVLIFIILMDAFETVVLPRRIKRSFRITGWFYRNSWGLWTRIGRHIKSANRREGFLAYFGPLSLIPLMGFWALGLIFGFACVQYGLGEHLSLGTEKITFGKVVRSEEHTSELQSLRHLVCRLLLEKKKKRWHAIHATAERRESVAPVDEPSSA